MIEDQIKGVLLAVILLLGLIGAAQYYYSHTTSEPFPELGILGPNQKIGDYPTNVLAGQNFTLYLYVGNHEGHVEYFNVLVKLGNNDSVVNGTNGMNAPVLATYRIILENNQTYLEPITLSLPNPGQNIRMVFELWTYNTSTNTFTYDYIYNQLWVNVTGVV
ncbi:MAG: DUF1616 domain-containing protein [Nitrososphaerota archaeon]|jgi:uncharacterized membrane protein|nr:DUF1616 domain-containing protein [Nitrososphaerota archaeon]